MPQSDKLTMEKVEEIANDLYYIEKGLTCAFEMILAEDQESQNIKGLIDCFRKAVAAANDKIWDIVNG